MPPKPKFTRQEIAAAALDIISPAAGGLGHSGKGSQTFAIFFKKHHINSL